ncbi:cytochrome P450 [Micromonospora sp. WMMD1082]|uniref:cytochrome P450 n=1 Tax=Micromonospora sp. WMMD1082 TaxID=3016104 RepID=UPI00241755A7|nr:cytochrome P450 [Micromonospora sp. WMMD1082]MDG4797029.1 cytochrome P450 [Micromonospora sp. WMMD1082]
MNQLTDVDLGDPELYVSGDPYRVWDHLREHAPMYRNRRPDGAEFWAITTHRLATAVYEDRQSFTSERGMRIGGEGAAGRASAGKMLIVTDGIRHRRMRDVLNPAFTPKSVHRLEQSMRAIVRQLLQEVRDLDSFDFVDRFAGRLPLYVTCQLLGVPRDDWDLMIELTRTAFGSVTEVDGEPISAESQEQAHADIFLYSADLIAERRRRPGDDLVSAMVTGQSAGYRMSDEDIQVNINGILTGGNETTRHATAGGVLAFVQNPSQWHRMRHETGAVMPTAVEEILRWTAPSLHVMRTALTDVMVGPQLVEAGEQVTVWNPAVNRDEAAFPDASRFDITRWPNRHVTFGMGQHFCIGAALARLELRVALDALASQVTRFELTGPVRRLRSNLMWGLDQLPVRIHLEDDRD